MRKLMIASIVALLVAVPTWADTISTDDDARIFLKEPDTVMSDGLVVSDYYTATSGNGPYGDYIFKGYMRFGLSSLTEDVGSATLTLTLSYEDMGDSESATIDIYGLNDGTTGETTWSETTLTWNNAPGNDTSGNGLNNATYLGSITVSGSDALGTTYTTSGTGTNLVSFLNADANDEVTLILTAGSVDSVASFGTGENGYSAPQLDITLIPEPATLCLLGLGGIGILIRRKARS